MDGRQPLDPHRPVCGLGFYEAEAFARWAGARLPTEQEWEHAAAELASDDAMTRGNFVESWALRPLGDEAAEDDASASLADCFGDVWEWTRSAHEPYPGYRPLPGVVSEYNGKFMSGQFVLRGGSCATPRSHIRRTYRNFNEPRDRRQFAGLRLARTPGA
jgi:formylglycine-generating enzyme required for sulfatase activity